ncbi:hypothetical protein FAUST_4870 [Fusarium austroamericanum]|uniref:Zn(2)-C6 fungal-type domain-containing protein n=1 Tax=Fusarium austroamericanum TaxID=282268 RepID=A0AAN6C289_FUSAU|nr:hypothetical protein FAUST_4870 [Fusarium austroamericanum]
MSPSSTKVASGGSFHTFQGIIPKKQPAASSNARPRVAGTRRITTPHACTECKRRKIRCDGKLPCGQCITSRAPKNCSYDKHRQRMIPSRKALDSLAQSLEECRSVLRRLYPNHDVSALRSLDKQELINLLAQSQCSLSDPLPSPPLESSFPKSGTPMMGSDSLLELQTSLEADLDSLIGELEFEVPGEQREASEEANYLAQQSWWDFGSRQWSSVSSVPPMMDGPSYGHDMMTPGQHSMYEDSRGMYGSLEMSLKCRRELSDRALVTTCSHIFCVECAQRLGITGQEAERRNTCPACESQLTKPDDAVITNLNPSEDYKTSVLSGLSPNVIMECAGRALSFWAYQTTQNICYQQHLYRALTEKYSSLGIRLEKTVSDANAEIGGLHHKMSGLAAEQESLRRKHEEISQAYKEKSRKVLQLQELYDKVKRRAELGQIQRAASDAVDHTLQAAQLEPGYGGNMTAQGNLENNHTPAFGQSHRVNVSGMNNGAARNYHNMATEGNQWSRLGGSSHRDLSGVPVGGLRRPTMGGSTVHQGTGLPTLTGTSMTGFGRSRQSPNNFAPGFINRGGLAGVGLTSGIKVRAANPAGTGCSIFVAVIIAIWRISMQTRRKLGKMGLRKGSDLRARFKAGEATSEGQGKPVISAPFVAPQQHPLSNTNDPTYEDRQPSSQQSIQHSKLGHQRDSLGSHPVHIASGNRYNGDDNQLCEAPGLSREEQEDLLKVVMDLELQIEKATIAANMYFHQAHGWAPQSPIPDDLDSLPQMLQGLYAVMTWMQQRIQVYEIMISKLRGYYE